MNFNGNFKTIQDFHTFTTNALKPHYESMPQWFKVQVDTIHERYDELKTIHYEHERNKTDKKGAKKNMEEWSCAADALIRKIYYTLKGDGNREVLNAYFEKTSPSKIKKLSERIGCVNRLIEISQHEKRDELEEFMDRLRDIQLNAGELMSMKSKTKMIKKASTKTAKGSRDSWFMQYKKLKASMKAFFYDTEIDYREFFLEAHPTKRQQISPAQDKNEKKKNETPEIPVKKEMEAPVENPMDNMEQDTQVTPQA